MPISQLKVPGSLATSLFLAFACSASEPPEELKDTAGVLESPKVKWTFQADKAVVSSAIAFGDRVRLGSGGDNFYALNIETGEPEWTVETTVSCSRALEVKGRPRGGTLPMRV